MLDLKKPDGSPPGPVRCEKCGSSREYVWAFLQGGWILPGTCQACKKRRDIEARAVEIGIRVSEYLKASGVPVRFQRYSVEGLQNEHNVLAMAQLIGWRVQQGESLHVCGETGRGKTTAVAVILAEKIRKLGIPGFFVSEFDFAKQLVRDLDGVRKAPLLVIDDLGSCKTMREFALEDLFGVIDYRERHTLPTIVTSEYTPEALMNMWLNEGSHRKRIAFRWFKMCRGEHITMEGPNYREILEGII